MKIKVLALILGATLGIHVSSSAQTNTTTTTTDHPQSATGHDDVSYIPYYASMILLNDTLGQDLSPRAKEIIGRPFTPLPDNISTREARIFTPIFLPLIYNVQKIPSLDLRLNGLDKSYAPEEIYPYPNTFNLNHYADQYLQEESPLLAAGFDPYKHSFITSREMHARFFATHPDRVRTTLAMLPEGDVEMIKVASKGYSGQLAINDVAEVNKQQASLEKKVIERVFWTRNFESSIHFAQNQLSDNWYKGGENSLNLNMRNYLNLTYNKDRVKWVNEIESKIGIFSNLSDTVNRYKISEDLFRFNSNFGVKAFRNWYYTLDFQLRSQILNNRNKEGVIVTRPFAPILADAGLGLKYEIDKKNFRGDPFSRFRFSVNVAPLSAAIVYTYTDKIDKKRVGLKEDESYKLNLGSSIRAALDYDISQTVNWQSRFFYSTSFKNAEAEWENTLSYALSRYFSTRLNVNLRFDDSVIAENRQFKDMIQYYEVFSFGFTYKLH